MPDVKNIVFTFIAIIVIPLLFFVLVELSLTVFGVGTSFAYFKEIDINGQPHYQENPDFADQFYPPALNIGPRENTFAVERSPELIRVYILGGSAAMGFPHRNHGIDLGQFARGLRGCAVHSKRLRRLCRYLDG